MAKRVLLLIPEGLTFEALPAEYQMAINNIFGQWVMPMPGTVAHEGLVICDAITHDSYDPAAMVALGIDWEIIALWNWDDTNNVITESRPFLKHAVLDRIPEPVTNLPHTWLGFPVMGLV